ncbi:hypothetical protein [Candidatus Regiella insecticola]|uniref:hypothetical protein n=1 Tax=Candidatus Regiella insecticola TaxID=138073 RepID=UPI0002D5FA54
MQNRDDPSELKIFSKYRPEVIDQAVKNNGYKINTEGAFYRTDISGAFRGAIHCPQELTEENAKQSIRNYQHRDYCSSNEAFLSQPVNEPYLNCSSHICADQAPIHLLSIFMHKKYQIF